MATKLKYVAEAQLQHLLTKLFARGFKGMGLSQEDFTTEMKTQLASLVANGATDAELKAVDDRLKAVEALIESDTDGAINKFNEIIAFLNGIADDKTLAGIMASKANASDVYNKTEVDTKLGGKANASETYTKTEVDAKLDAKLNAADLVALTDAEIDAMIEVAGA